MRRDVVLVVLVFLTIVAPGLAQAQGSPSATGGFHFVVAGASGNVEFHANALGSSGEGAIDFSATQETGEGQASTVKVGADIDCLQVVGNRAAMSGVVKTASNADYLGRRMVLAVRDGGEGNNAPRDGFTWGFYLPDTRTWTPEDAEVPGDPGATLSWWATDAERTDDSGTPAGASTPQEIDCHSFGLDAYAYEELPRGSGNIQVRP